jgi:hypothetical protein
MADDGDTAPTDSGSPTPADLRTIEVRVGGSGRVKWLAAFIALIAVVAGAVALLADEDEPDADAALTAAQAAVDDADSYRFELRQTSHVTSGDPDGSGSESTTRTVSQGEVASGDSWRTVVQLPADQFDDETYTPYETRRVGDTVYDGGGDSTTEADVGPHWTETPAAQRAVTIDDYAAFYDDAQGEEGDDDYVDEPQYRLETLLGAYFLPISDDPANVERLVRGATKPDVEERLEGGGLRLRATLPPIAEIAKVAREPIPPVALTLDLDARHLPTVVRFDVSLEGASEAIEVRFSDWGGAIAVTAPDDADVDHTPWIEEELIGLLAPELVRAPTAVPAGLDLVSAITYEGYSDDLDPDPKCSELDLTYGGKAEADHLAALGDEVDYEDPALQEFFDAQPNVDLAMSPISCDVDGVEFDDVVAGLPARASDEGYVELRDGDVLIAVSSANVSDADLAAMIHSLRATTVEGLSAQVPQWARDQSTSGGYFGGPAGGGGFTSIASAIG